MNFYMKISIKVFNKLVISFLFFIPRYAQITENSNFVTSLQYLKKERSDEVDFACR